MDGDLAIYLQLLTPFRQKNLFNSNTRKLEHLGRSNKFVGPLYEFLTITRTFFLSLRAFSIEFDFFTRIRTFQRL